MPNLNRAADSGIGNAARPERRRCARRRILDSGQMVVVEIGPAEAGLLVDLSPKGINVQAAKALPPGARITSKYHLPGGAAPIQPTYEVVWSDPKGKAGLRFLYMSENDQRELERWIAAQIATEPPPSPVPTPIIAAPLRKIEDISSDKDVLGLEFCPISPAPPRLEKALEPNQPLDSLDSNLNLLVEEARRLTEADGAAIALRDGQGIVCRAQAGTAPDLGVRLNPEAGLSGECVRTGKPVTCVDAANDPRVPPGAIEQLKLSSVLIVPVLVSNSVAGIVEVLSSRPAAFDESHRTALDRIAATLASHLSNESSAIGGSSTGSNQAIPSTLTDSAPLSAASLRNATAAESPSAVTGAIPAEGSVTGEPLQLEAEATPVAAEVVSESPAVLVESQEVSRAVAMEKPKVVTLEFEPRAPKVEPMGPVLVMGSAAPAMEVAPEPAIPFGKTFVLSSYVPAPRPRWTKAIPLIAIILVILSTISGWMVSTGRFPFVKRTPPSSQVAPAPPPVASPPAAAPAGSSPAGAPALSKGKALGTRILTRPVHVIPLKSATPAGTGKAQKPAPKPEAAPKSRPRAE